MEANDDDASDEFMEEESFPPVIEEGTLVITLTMIFFEQDHIHTFLCFFGRF